MTDFDHDIFISYALVDDKKFTGVEAGWVSLFVETLESRLSAAIGRFGRLKPWWDRSRLHENQPLDKQIQQALERTAFLVVVLSTGFLESPWCPKELEAFRLAVERQSRADSRIFIVDLGNVTEQQRRNAFSNYKPFDFWKIDDRRKRRLLGFPAPNAKDHPDFYDAVEDLANKLKEEFDEMISARLSATADASNLLQAAAAVQTQTPTTGGTIYVAETSDDLNTARKQLIMFLESHQFRIVCGGRNAGKVDAWQDAASRELSEVTCVVQLLGQYPGRELDDATSGLVSLQHKLAVSYILYGDGRFKLVVG